MFQRCIPLEMHCFQSFTAVDATFWSHINRCGFKFFNFCLTLTVNLPFWWVVLANVQSASPGGRFRLVCGRLEILAPMRETPAQCGRLGRYKILPSFSRLQNLRSSSKLYFTWCGYVCSRITFWSLAQLLNADSTNIHFSSASSDGYWLPRIYAQFVTETIRHFLILVPYS